MAESQGVRPAQFADGQWYPADPEALRSTVRGFLGDAPKTISGEVIGLVAPHAGYAYSGPIAANAYKQVEGRDFDLVAVISPLHRVYAGPLVVTDSRYYETPLGRMEIDQAALQAVEREVPVGRIRRDDEHSLEIQLPFLQVALGDFKLLPLMMGAQDVGSAEKLAGALGGALEGRKALLVASSDLYHGQSYEEAVAVNVDLERRVAGFDAMGLAKDLSTGTAQACGGGPIVAVMLASRALGATRAKVLALTTSADVTGNRWGYIVGYMAAGLYRDSP